MCSCLCYSCCCYSYYYITTGDDEKKKKRMISRLSYDGKREEQEDKAFFVTLKLLLHVEGFHACLNRFVFSSFSFLFKWSNFLRNESKSQVRMLECLSIGCHQLKNWIKRMKRMALEDFHDWYVICAFWKNEVETYYRRARFEYSALGFSAR